jgi:hypothetical protein
MNRSFLVATLRALFVVTAFLFMAHTASAATLVYYPNDQDLEDLDHHFIYTWRITNLNTSIPSGDVVTGASLTFHNIRNWDTNPNKLFLHLLDTSIPGGGSAVTGSQVSPGNTSTSSDNAVHYARKTVDDSTDTIIKDEFAVDGTENYYALTNALVADGTNNTPLGDHTALNGTRTESWVQGNNSTDPNFSFTSAPETYVYNFTEAQIAALNDYIDNGGDIALALDPDCHFFNDKIELKLTTGQPPVNQAVPEPASLTLFGLGLSALYMRQRRAQRRKASEPAEPTT